MSDLLRSKIRVCRFYSGVNRAGSTFRVLHRHDLIKQEERVREREREEKILYNV